MNADTSSLLIVGSIAFDTIHNHLGAHPRVLGGSATYAALAASQLVPVRLVGVVGEDFPSEAVEMFERRGIDTTGVEYAKGQTFHWEGRYSGDLNTRTTLQTNLNVFADFEPKIPDAFRRSPYVLLGNIAPDLQHHVLDQVDQPRLVIADTMNLWIDTALEPLRELLNRIDILVINEEEARQLSGFHHPLAVAEIFCAPAYPLKAVADPTGAGDAFAGGLLGSLAGVTNGDLRSAVICGSAVASYCVQAVGVEGLADLTREQILRRVADFRSFTQF